MALDDDLKEIITKKKGIIVIVDDACWVQNELFSQHSDTEMECIETAMKMGIDLLLPESSYSQYTSPEDAYELEGHIQRSHPDLLLVRPKMMMAGAPDLSTTFNKIAKFRNTHPNTKTYLYLPQSRGPVESALNKVVPIFQQQGMFDETITIDFDSYPTTWHHLRALLTGEPGMTKQQQHSYKNEMWRKNYLPLIDKSLRAGNSQTKNNYQFIILSDREITLLGNNEVNAKEKVIVKPLFSQLSEEELQNCAAIFMDNDWDKSMQGSLGNGIKALKNLRKQLDQKGTNPPIIYQSGHNQEAFTQKEIKEIENLGAVLATKEIFPKVCTKEKAEKEEEISTLLQAHPALGKYTVKTYKFNKQLGKEPTCVVCTKIVEKDEPEDGESLKKIGIEKETYSHRMYVLALLHNLMKEQLGNETISKTEVKRFRNFAYVLKAYWPDEQKEFLKEPETRKLYERIIQEHEKDKPTTIIHNDTKWDNWFGNVLGDFADSCADTEYKDLANALLDMETSFKKAADEKWVEKHTENYIKIRQSIEPGFKPAEDFSKKVKELVYVQAIRLARNKIGQQNHEELVENLIQLAKTYRNIL